MPTPTIVPPIGSSISPDVLKGNQPNTLPDTKAVSQPTAANRKITLQDKISKLAQDDTAYVNPDPSISTQDGVLHTQDDSLPNSPVVGNDGKPLETVPPIAHPDQKNYKALLAALDQRDVKVKELEDELGKIRPNTDRVIQLETELNTKQKDYDEVQAFRSKVGLLNSDVLHKNIIEPRQNIATWIKNEFKNEGIDEALWEQAQSVRNRAELETLAKENIDSDLLRADFYKVFFQDQELARQETAALSAPSEYLQRARNDEAAHRNQTKEIAERNFSNTWQLAITDAKDMALKLGENKLVEILEIPGNTDHNEKVVKPILTAAYQGAEAELKERLALGLPVTREDAARKIYLWSQALAAQAASADRMRWYRESEKLKSENAMLRERLEKKVERNNPTPGAREPAPEASNTSFKRGNSFAESIGNMAKAYKDGSI